MRWSWKERAIGGMQQRFGHRSAPLERNRDVARRLLERSATGRPRLNITTKPDRKPWPATLNVDFAARFPSPNGVRPLSFRSAPFLKTNRKQRELALRQFEGRPRIGLECPRE